MATIKQLDANRRNAQKSTGPRTAEGKLASSQNATKTGIHAKSLVIRDEDPAGLETLTTEFYDRHDPSPGDERSLVDTLIAVEWRLRRLRKAEAQFWDGEPDLKDAFDRTDLKLQRLGRMIAAAELSQHRALRDLEYLQRTRQSEPPEPTEIRVRWVDNGTVKNEPNSYHPSRNHFPFGELAPPNASEASQAAKRHPDPQPLTPRAIRPPTQRAKRAKSAKRHPTPPNP